MTTDELLKIENQKKSDKIKRDIYLKQYSWFVLLPADKIYRDSFLKGKKIYMTFEQLKENLKELEEHEIKNIKMECKFVYRTNSWAEKLTEFDY